MAMRVRKGYPLDIPPYDWDENDFDWSGRIQEFDDDQLPVAYLRAHLVSLGLTIHYQSPNAAAQDRPMRVPCILMGGPSDLISSQIGTTKERIDKLGLIHCSKPSEPNLTVDGDGGPLLTGLAPFYGGPPWFVKDEATYLGGRLMVILGKAGTEPYFTISITEQADQVVTELGTTAY